MKKIPIANPYIEKSDAEEVRKTITKGWITMGKKTEIFESMLSKYLNVKYVVAMNNGTSTLDAILSALNIKQNDEIIVPDMTYISTANVAEYKKAKLILVDCDKSTYNISVKDLIKKISNKTKLIMVTDMKGMPVDYKEIIKISKKNKIPLIADSAESLGSSYNNVKIGSQTLAHSFSFFANKNITTAEGGAVVTNSIKIYKKLICIRNQGQKGRYNHVMLGNNYRMNDILATLGIQQFKKIDKIINYKNKIAKIYNSKLQNVVMVPHLPEYVTRHSWYNYTIRVPKKLRNRLINFLSKNGIETRISFPPIHTQPYYKKKLSKSNFPNSIDAYNTMIDLPIWYKMPMKDVNFICNKVINFLDKNR